VDINKIDLRRQLLQQRQAMPMRLWREDSKRICCQIQSCPQFDRAQTILAYQNCRQEPDLTNLFDRQDKDWGLPRCVGKSLIWHRWSPLQPLVTGAYGILEPAAEFPRLEPDCVDLILVPAVAIDRGGYRLGYGGGYYDRLRADPQWRKIPTIGIVFDFAYLDVLPIDPWDLKLDGVCTELGYRQTQD
jgi:5-formyltetrahydrofolate cyclo-ligase